MLQPGINLPGTAPGNSNRMLGQWPNSAPHVPFFNLLEQKAHLTDEGQACHFLTLKQQGYGQAN